MLRLLHSAVQQQRCGRLLRPLSLAAAAALPTLPTLPAGTGELAGPGAPGPLKHTLMCLHHA